MGFDPTRHHRRSVRLPLRDYGQSGRTFVTICTTRRRCVFGRVADGKMVLSPLGEIAADEWRRALDLRQAVLRPGPWVVMPNHVHLVVAIANADPARAWGRPERTGRFVDGVGPETVASIVLGYKAAVASRARRDGVLPRGGVWQRGFHDHVIRYEPEFQRIATYVATNPARWHRDRENPFRTDEGEGA